MISLNLTSSEYSAIKVAIEMGNGDILWIKDTMEVWSVSLMFPSTYYHLGYTRQRDTEKARQDALINGVYGDFGMYRKKPCQREE